jgi:starch phosphorylase
LGRAGSPDLSKLRALEATADDAGFQERWRAVKRDNKAALANRIRERTGVAVDPSALFDIQVTRIHEYKRQHLNLLHVVTLYDRLRRDSSLEIAPRCVLFGGKAAPGYFMAKLIICLINGVAEVVNADPALSGV